MLCEKNNGSTEWTKRHLTESMHVYSLMIKRYSLNIPANKCDLETIKELKKYRKKR